MGRNVCVVMGIWLNVAFITTGIRLSEGGVKLQLLDGGSN